MQKRRSRDSPWVTVSTYLSDVALKSKGAKGGKYAFVDENSETGEWTYRVVDTERGGKSSQLCQAVVDVQSKSEQTVNTVAVGAIILLIAGLAFAGVSLDPLK